MRLFGRMRGGLESFIEAGDRFKGIDSFIRGRANASI